MLMHRRVCVLSRPIAQGITGKFYIPVAHEGVVDAHVAAHLANRTLTKGLWALSDELTQAWVR